MTRGDRHAGALAGASVLLALVGALVGLGSAAPTGQVASPPPTPVAVVIQTVSYLALALEGTMLVLIAWALWPGRRGRRTPEHELTVPPLPMHPLLRLALSVLRLRPARPHLPSAPPGVVGSPVGGPGSSGTVAGGEAGWIALGLAALIVAGVAVLALRGLRRRAAVGKERRPQAMVAALEEGLEALDREPDPRRAVILAYAAMERTLSARGWPRQPWEAPFEYLERVPREMGAGHVGLHRLTDLFEVARYSHHAIDGRMRATALAELRRVRSELGVRSSSA
jgi:hypothetical protein